MRSNSIKTEVFVCETCGNRQRLASMDRHWCEECKSSCSVEMTPVRFRGFAKFWPAKPDAVVR